MKEKEPRRLYRIGDFAHYMGVTPDFLKHYEKHGLLQATSTDAGYRFFHFDQSSRILEYMRLRSYGVPIKEMGEMLSAPEDTAMELLTQKADLLKKELERTEAVIEEHQRLKDWYERRRTKPTDWEVVDVEPQYFLPHSFNRDFIKDERIYELLKVWMKWLPLVKSALRVAPPPSPDLPSPVYWGLMVPQSIARRYGIPVNESVLTEAGGKAFVYHFVSNEHGFSMDDISLGRHPMFQQMDKLGLKPCGSLYLVVEMKLTEDDGSRRSGAGRFIVPIEKDVQCSASRDKRGNQ